jgi:hypothetical protein
LHATYIKELKRTLYGVSPFLLKYTAYKQDLHNSNDYFKWESWPLKQVDTILKTYRRINTCYGGIQYKIEESLIIPITNTIIYPQAVMILDLIQQPNKNVKTNL